LRTTKSESLQSPPTHRSKLSERARVARSAPLNVPAEGSDSRSDLPVKARGATHELPESPPKQSQSFVRTHHEKTLTSRTSGATTSGAGAATAVAPPRDPTVHNELCWHQTHSFPRFTSRPTDQKYDLLCFIWNSRRSVYTTTGTKVWQNRAPASRLSSFEKLEVGGMVVE
jgi:hypothetical protein